MLKKINEFSIRYSVLVIIMFIGITIFFGLQLPRAQLDPSIKSLLPDDVPSKINLEKIEEIFGGSEMIFVAMENEDTILNTATLQRIKDMSSDMERIDGLDKVISLSLLNSINSANGELVIKNLLRQVPQSSAEFEALRRDILQNSMLNGVIVTEDFKATVILGFLAVDADDEVVINGINDSIAKHPGPEEMHLGGLPVLRDAMAYYMQKDFSKFMPVGLLIMLLFLFLFFRILRGVLLPFIIVVMSIIVAFGTLVLVGWTVQMTIILLPVILIAIANDYGIHLISRYQYEIQNLDDDQIALTDKSKKKEIKSQVIMRIGASLSWPVIAAGLTTIVGFLTLITHLVESSRNLGIISAVGIAFALLGSIMFIPAILSLLPLSKKRPIKSTQGLLYQLLKGTGNLVIKRPKTVILVMSSIVALIALGLPRLVVDSSPIKFFSPKSDIALSDKLINEKFGGSTSLNLVAKGDIKSPEVMRALNSLTQELEADENIGNVTSISEVIRQMNKIVHDDDPAFDTIPDNRNAIAQLFELYSFGGDPADFDKMVDFDYTQALLTAQITSTSTVVLKDKINYLNTKITPEGPFTLVGGFSEILVELSQALVNGQLISLGLSVLLVCMLVAIIFRSIRFGLLSAIPIGGAIIALFGLMGYMEIELSTITTMLSSVMVGAGIDYTIHYLWQYKESLRQGRSMEEAIMDGYLISGRGILFNALSVVVGFTALLFSNFLPVQFFGFLIMISITTCLLGALLFLPAMLVIGKSKFYINHS